jgi:hypothetical protein
MTESSRHNILVPISAYLAPHGPRHNLNPRYPPGLPHSPRRQPRPNSPSPRGKSPLCLGTHCLLESAQLSLLYQPRRIWLSSLLTSLWNPPFVFWQLTRLRLHPFESHCTASSSHNPSQATPSGDSRFTPPRVPIIQRRQRICIRSLRRPLSLVMMIVQTVHAQSTNLFHVTLMRVVPILVLLLSLRIEVSPVRFLMGIRSPTKTMILFPHHLWRNPLGADTACGNIDLAINHSQSLCRSI